MTQIAEPKVGLAEKSEIDQLAQHVRSRVSGQVRDLQLVLHESGIVLQGWAPTYYAKQLAQQAVMEASQCSILANDIEVSSPARRV